VLGSKEYREQRGDEVKDADILTLRHALQDRPEIKEVLSKITGFKLLDLKNPGKKSTAKPQTELLQFMRVKHIQVPLIKPSLNISTRFMLVVYVIH